MTPPCTARDADGRPNHERSRFDDDACNPDARRGYLTPADGRRLSYTEWEMAGRPVLDFRGLPSSSLGDAIDHTKLAEAQVRRITV